jgi:hypothetical protein
MVSGLNEGPRAPSPGVVLRLLNVGKRDTGDDLAGLKQRPVFILSTGRTGTQYLAYHFDKNPDVCALHEPAPSRGLRFWTVAYLEGSVDLPMMTSTLRRYRTGFFAEITESVYVESNNFLAGFAESLIAEFDQPTLIHVVRDPRTYVRSAINKGAASGLKGIVNSVVPFAHLDLERDSDDPTIQRSARYWTLVNEHLRGVGERYPSYHLFKYEDLFESASGEFARLVDTVGAGEHALSARREVGKVNQSPRDLVPPWEEWSRAQQRVLTEECGEAMTRFGYVT